MGSFLLCMCSGGHVSIQMHLVFKYLPVFSVSRKFSVLYGKTFLESFFWEEQRNITVPSRVGRTVTIPPVMFTKEQHRVQRSFCKCYIGRIWLF